MEYKREKITMIWEELAPLIRANSNEVELFGKPVQLDLDYITRAEEEDIYVVFTARANGILKGYCAFMVYQHIHHIDLKIANQDVIYIEKKHRGHAANFIRYCDSELKKLGIDIVLQHSTVLHPWGKVLERIGYKEIQTTYARSL